MAKRITMHDVARVAGVSLMTVSRVVNEKDDVSPGTRQKVMGVIKELNYRPSSIARSLATQRTGTLGVVVPDISNPFFSSIVRIAEEEAYSQDYNVFLGNTNEDPAREMAVLHSLESHQVDGLILCSSRLEDDVLGDILSRFPTAVLVFRERIQVDVGSITLDDNYGGEMAIKHLLNRGHDNIALISGPSISFSAYGRFKGYQKALNDAGIPVREEWIIRCQPNVEAGHQAVHSLLIKYPEVTALFCHNDLIAVGALQAAADHGRRVPEDIAVIGYDDIRLAALVTPSLTTVHVPRASIGTQAMRLLLAQIYSNSIQAKEIHLQPELILRQSAP